MLNLLPIEIQVQILSSNVGITLRSTSSHFYLLDNDLFFNKLVKEFGEDVVITLQKIYPWLRTYIKSLDVFRKTSRQIVSTRLNLKDSEYWNSQNQPPDLKATEFVKDSWRFVYALFKNKRLFAEYSDYRIDEPSNYVFNHYVEINRTYLLSYSKAIWLAPGKYNLNIGLVVKHGSGLGTTKFEIRYKSLEGENFVKTFYPPTNINEILPKNRFCFLRVAEFEIPPMQKDPRHSNSKFHHQQLYKVQLVMEEIGLYLKSGFTIYFIDISQPSMLLNDYDLLYYTCQDTDYRKYINIPLKNFYKVLCYLQNLGVDDFEADVSYGTGMVKEIESCLPLELNFEEQDANRQPDDELMEYAKFFFCTSNRRYFKFNTVYQRRQFSNRFGNFEKEDPLKKNGSASSYDPDGLKWRMPTLGPL